MSNIAFVNIFHGVGKSVTPQCESLFSKWNLLKGKAGNTSPSACLPFGAVACSPYSGGYSAGYGNYKANGKFPPAKFFEGDKLVGFSHFTHSGSGAFGFYYNYLVVCPHIKIDQGNIFLLKAFDEENAMPGYYSCRLIDENIRCELTISNKVAIHRYTSENGEPLNVTIDVSNNGLQQDNPRLYGYSSESKLRLYENAFGGYVTMQGVKIYFYATCSAPNCKQTIWRNDETLAIREGLFTQTESRFGCSIETKFPSIELKIGFSLMSETHAMASAQTSAAFGSTQKTAKERWSDKLNAIELTGVTDEDREIFYSNYYHSMIKPCGWQKESFLWTEKETFYLDFATLWDVYKTQMPFIFTFFKDEGRGIVKTLLKYGKQHGKLFNALMLTSNMNVESTQACCLGCYVLYDAYVRGLVDSLETDDMFSVVKLEIGQYEEAILSAKMEKTTKLLDVTLIAQSFAELAKKLHRTEDEQYFSRIAKHWTDAFGNDGLLKENYPYYEGNRWNYSFRFVHDIEKRTELAGGKAKLTKQLDAFFAFTDENAEEDRFEGFNNETDMETPYFYHYVGRYDRLSEILRECREVCFRKGREGLPGNNDSGGLSACYIWNFLGLFPISGQDNVFLGVPQAKKAVLRLSNNNTLTIRAEGNGETVKQVLFNGEQITGYSIPVAKLMQGGELIFTKMQQ